jgi:HSP20 family protein
MANISIYDPLSTRLNRFFNHFGLTNPNYFDELDGMRNLSLKMDVSEDDKGYTVHADLPGVKKDDIHVSVSGNQITINAEIKDRKEEKKGKNVIHSERYEGKIYRSFTLDSDVDESKTEARFTDGVLELMLPKKAENGISKQIKVQ